MVTMPASVTSIGNLAFACCNNISYLYFNGTIKQLNAIEIADTNSELFNAVIICTDGRFNVRKNGKIRYTYNQENDTLIISGSSDMPDCEELSSYGYSSIKNVVIEEGITRIGDMTFYDCTGLESITIPDSVTSIGYSAFYGCESLESITIPDSVTSIGDMTFSDCTGLESITIGSGVTSIGYDAFHNCTSLANITIPDTVTSVGDYAFYGCNSLTSVTIGSGVTSIGDHVFGFCEELTDIYYNGTKEQWNAVDKADFDNYGYRITVHFLVVSDEPFAEDSALMMNESDSGKMTISGFAPGATVNDLMKMTADGWTASVETADGSDRIGTGSVITLTSDTGETVECTAVVYGDTNGDAWYDGTDSLIVNCISNGLLSEAQLGEAVYTAADCNHDDVIDGSDVAILEQAGLILANIDQSKTPEELFEDAAYSEYINLIDQTPVTAEKAAEDAIDTTPADEPAAGKTLIQKIIDFIIYIFKMITSNISKVF